eukprot:Nitzschia sp. Nitz4//scaffold13_size275219//131202//133337//NITZ4_000873-RA/size275219-augustus-gene-0.233-mRNA-1//1//CDS//3329536011//770//frame0
MGVLVPLLCRRGKRPRCVDPKASIQLKKPFARDSYVIVGRLELLSSMYKACGCSANVFSTRGKCARCKAFKWAAKFLSREMLKISIEDGGRALMFVRGSHAAVIVQSPTNGCCEMGKLPSNHTNVCMPTERWRGGYILERGTTLSIQEPNGDSELQFQFWERCDFAPRIAIFPLGQDLPKQRIAILRKEAAERKRVITEEYFQATHWVISRQIPDLECLSNFLGCSEAKVRDHLNSSFVQCVAPEWLKRCSNPPKQLDFWSGYVSRSQFLTSDADPLTVTTKSKVSSNGSRRCNGRLAQQLVLLSKAYETASIYPEEEWKALQFHKLAGRLQSLDFDVACTTEDMKKIRNLPGVGSSTIALIREILTTGTSTRLDELRNDPIRAAIRKMSCIHGIGRVTAISLSQQGYKSIADLREAVAKGSLILSREQKIGLDCYEDLCDEIPRDEVEEIGNLVKRSFAQICDIPSEVTIMGSFRRGKSLSGDVDVLITMKQFEEWIPRDLLSKLVGYLARQGHVANHITILPNVDLFENDVDSGASIPQKLDENPSQWIHQGGAHGNTYMGVFFSPRSHRKRRRVDIKIYPYNQKAFASLYFTGGKWFNRSMRLWATDKFNWRLSDKGLVDKESGEFILRAAHTEEEIFRKLQLRYKEPKDRMYFDDVEPL